MQNAEGSIKNHINIYFFIRLFGFGMVINMNINMQGHNLVNSFTLKSTKERMERQAKRDNQIAFFEQQKEKLKNRRTDSIEDIAWKLALLHGYNDKLAAAKA